MILKNLLFSFTLCCGVTASAAVVNVGKSGSYSDQFPGTDEAGRNSYPTGLPRLSGDAKGRPVPTNDWWSNQLYSDHASNLFNYPLGMRTTDAGLVPVKTVVYQGAPADTPIEVTVEGISCSATTICDYSDWTVTMRWENGEGYMDATVGVGMPMVYFTKQSSNDVRININQGQVSIHDEMVLITNSYNGVSYAVYAPTGSEWVQSGNAVTSSLAGKDYWSVVMLPDGDAATIAADWKQYAYVFPGDTRTEWRYDESSGKVTTDYIITADVKEGDYALPLIGLLPHHWAHLSDAPLFEGHSYETVRGELKMMAADSFTTVLSFHGILPTLPAVDAGKEDFSEEHLDSLIEAVVKDHGFQDWTDSYNDGQLLNRLVQTARIAKLYGNEEQFEKAFTIIKEKVEDWLTYEEGEIAFLFYYQPDWTAMLGYPAGHGQDSLINDHHFHWGYIIHAAAFLEQYQPGWADLYGDMISLLIRDAAGTDRNDDMFPYLRSFSPFAGHCWANGMAAMGIGNDQESSSESMQFHSALIHWGELTGDKSVRDLGIYMYVTEQTAIEEYWFDAHDRNLPDSYGYFIASRIFTNGYDAQTFWGAGLDGAYGIQLYPIHGGSFYLMNHADFARRFWGTIEKDTEILSVPSASTSVNLWHDTMWQYLAMMDSQRAIDMYNQGGSRGIKFGISQALTYHWIHALSQLGSFESGMTASHPLAMAFTKDGITTYVAQNYSSEQLTVDFSDGHSMTVPAGELGVSEGVSSAPVVSLVSPEAGMEIRFGESVDIVADARVNVDGVGIERVEFYAGEALIGSREDSPYVLTWSPEAPGVYSLTAKAFSTEGRSATSASVSLTVSAGDTPGGGGDSAGECTFKSTEISDGQALTEGYTVSFKTLNGNVSVTATLHDSKEGLAVAYIHDVTDGFREIEMQKISDDTFIGSVGGYAIGETVRMAVKFAFAGGLSRTAVFEYEVGSACDDQGGVTESEFVNGVMVYPNPSESVFYVRYGSDAEARMQAVKENGIVVFDGAIRSAQPVDVSEWSRGLYLLRISIGDSVVTLPLMKE